MRQHVPPGPPPERPHHYPGPPPMWHGGKGKGPPPGPWPPPPGPGGHPPPLPPWRQHPPPWHGGKGKGDFGDHRGPNEDPYGSGATIAPPSQIRDANRTGADPNTGKEYKLLMADGLVVNNVPPELLSMATLHRHFRRFGEIMKLTIHDAEGRAFIQYAEQPAAEAAKQEVVLDCPDIEVSWVKRKTKGGGKNKRDKGQLAPDGSYMPRVLISDPEERKKFEDATQRRGQVELKKKELLQQYTKQLQMVLSKLQESGLSEEKRESYNSILVKIKEKMNSVNSMAAEPPPAPKAEATTTTPSMQREGPVRYTLDLRTRAVRIVKDSSWVSEKKAKEDTNSRLGPGNHGLRYVQWEPGSEKHAIVMFVSRWYAEQAFERRAEIGMFDMEWCENPPPPPPKPEPVQTQDQMAEDGNEGQNGGPASGLPSELLRADEDANLPAAMEEVDAPENAAATGADAEVAAEPAADADQPAPMEDAQELEGDAKALKEAMEKAEAEDAMTAVDLNDDEQ